MQGRGDGTREAVMEWSVLDFDHRFSGRPGDRSQGDRRRGRGCLFRRNGVQFSAGVRAHLNPDI